jgi:hypothetical protein
LWSEFYSAEQMEAITLELASAGWPAVHHSDGYVERWFPHYRVVSPVWLPPAWREPCESGDLVSPAGDDESQPKAEKPQPAPQDTTGQEAEGRP